MAQPASASSTLSEEKIPSASSDSAGTPPVETHKENLEAFERASDLENERPSLYPVTSYASQIGGEGSFPLEESPQDDPNLVQWDGPDDPANPYNW